MKYYYYYELLDAALDTVFINFNTEVILSDSRRVLRHAVMPRRTI